MKRFLAVILAAAMMAFGAGCGNEPKAYPEKPVTLVIPYSAGGTTDVIGRQLAVQLEKHLGTPVTVVNKPGASGSIGAKYVLDSKSDGYTLLFTADSLGTQRVMGISEMSYDDFSPIMAVANDPKVIVVAGNSPFNTIEDLIEYMKANPGKTKMSSTGPGGSGHVQMLIYNKLGLSMSMTSYQGGGECILAVIGGQVDFTNSNLSTLSGYIESGDLKLLAVAGEERLAAYPDVPALSEVIPEAAEYMNIPFVPLSLVVKNDVPEDIQAIIREAAIEAVAEEDFAKFMDDNCIDKLYEKYETIDDIKAFYKDWESMVSWLLYDAGAAKYSPEQFGIERL